MHFSFMKVIMLDTPTWVVPVLCLLSPERANCWSSQSPASVLELSEGPFLPLSSHMDAVKVVFFIFYSGILVRPSERERAGLENWHTTSPETWLPHHKAFSFSYLN